MATLIKENKLDELSQLVGKNKISKIQLSKLLKIAM